MVQSKATISSELTLVIYSVMELGQCQRLRTQVLDQNQSVRQCSADPNEFKTIHKRPQVNKASPSYHITHMV